MINKSYKVRLYPDKEQEVLLNKTFGCSRLVWNTLLDSNIKGYETEGKGWKQNYNTTVLKEDFTFLKEVSAAAMQQKSRDLKETYSQWFKSVTGKRKKVIGYPKFKRKGQKDSYRLPFPKFTVKEEQGILRLEKIGFVSCKLDRTFPADCRFISVTVSKTSSNKYYAAILVEQEMAKYELTGKRVGIDLGIKDLMTLSTGHTISNPRFYRENQPKIKRLQQHLSRKTKGSTRYLKAKKKLAVEHERVTNKRSWFTNNITTSIVKDFDIIALESLTSEGMLGKVSNINKAIYDTSMYEVVRQLKYKSDWYGKTFVQVGKWFPSSQLCCKCKTINKQTKDLKVRSWACPACHEKHDRDLNASINILQEAFKGLSGESPDYSRGDFIDDFTFVKEIDDFVETINLP